MAGTNEALPRSARCLYLFLSHLSLLQRLFSLLGGVGKRQLCENPFIAAHLKALQKSHCLLLDCLLQTVCIVNWIKNATNWDGRTERKRVFVTVPLGASISARTRTRLGWGSQERSVKVQNGLDFPDRKSFWKIVFSHKFLGSVVQCSCLVCWAVQIEEV